MTAIPGWEHPVTDAQAEHDAAFLSEFGRQWQEQRLQTEQQHKHPASDHPLPPTDEPRGFGPFPVLSRRDALIAAAVVEFAAVLLALYAVGSVVIAAVLVPFVWALRHPVVFVLPVCAVLLFLAWRENIRAAGGWPRFCRDVRRLLFGFRRRR